MLGLNFDKQQLQKVCRDNDISYLGAFGSVARGEARADSDIDLIARFSARKTFFDLGLLEEKLGGLFGRKVDLLTENGISPYLRERILAELKPLYE